MKKLFLIAAVMSAFLSCSGNGKEGGVRYRPFPKVEIPSVVSDEEEKLSYALAHYWDAFFAEDGVSDSSAVLGVRNEDMETAAAAYFELAAMVPKAEGQKAVEGLFRSIEEKQAADTSSHVYLLLTELVSKYLYDPNSPYRDEDLYLPFVRGLAASGFTRDDVRPAYVFEERMCSLNRYGTPAADFRFRDIRGREHSLYGTKAEYTVLFFSNPGCESCRKIKEELEGSRALSGLLGTGRAAVLNIYIDRELDKWRESVASYPESWTCGYDFRYIIREDAIYNVRAIPSLYLLDKDKKVLMKDAETRNLLKFINNII